jgi:hypothetical protein
VIDVANPVFGGMLAGQHLEPVADPATHHPLVQELHVRAPRVVFAYVKRQCQVVRSVAVKHQPERGDCSPVRGVAEDRLELGRELVERRPERRTVGRRDPEHLRVLHRDPQGTLAAHREAADGPCGRRWNRPVIPIHLAYHVVDHVVGPASAARLVDPVVRAAVRQHDQERVDLAALDHPVGGLHQPD